MVVALRHFSDHQIARIQDQVGILILTVQLQRRRSTEDLPLEVRRQVQVEMRHTHLVRICQRVHVVLFSRQGHRRFAPSHERSRTGQCQQRDECCPAQSLVH